MLQLKEGVESFQVVDGPFAGQKYKRGKVYREDQIPENELHKFVKTEDREIAETKTRKKRKGKKPGK